MNRTTVAQWSIASAASSLIMLITSDIYHMLAWLIGCAIGLAIVTFIAWAVRKWNTR